MENCIHIMVKVVVIQINLRHLQRKSGSVTLKMIIRNVIIPQKIMINGVSYQVTSIAAKAFKANKKIRSIVIPSTVRKIGKQAFLNCKNLKKITLKTSYLSKKAIGAKAFKGIHKKATIKVPKKQKKAYQKLLKSKGVGKKAKIK